MSDISSSENNDERQIRPEDVPNIKNGMFVSGWDDPDNDIGIEEDKNPHGKIN
jgi:hypothetical protein